MDGTENHYVKQNKSDSQKSTYNVFSLMCRTCADVNVFGYGNVCLSVSVGAEIRKGTMSKKEGILREVGEEKVLERMAWKHTVVCLGKGRRPEREHGAGEGGGLGVRGWPRAKSIWKHQKKNHCFIH